MYIARPLTNTHFHIMSKMKEGVFYHVWKVASNAVGKYVLHTAN